MATLIYEQTFAAGHSTFENSAVTTENVNGSDTLYPEIRQSRAVKVTLAAGPAGENVIEVDRSGGGNGANGGIWAEIPEYPTDETIHIDEGYAEIWWKFRQADLDDAVEVDLVSLFDYGTGSGILTLYANAQSGPYEWRVRYPRWTGSTVTNTTVTGLATISLPSYVDTWVKFRLAWKCSAVGDGYLTVTDVTHSTTILTLTAMSFMFGWPVAPYAADRGLITAYFIAFDGFAGQATNLRLYSGVFEPEEPEPILPPLIPQPKACPPCIDRPGTVPDPTGALPPWTALCSSGGIVDTVADLGDGENWTM